MSGLPMSWLAPSMSFTIFARRGMSSTGTHARDAHSALREARKLGMAGMTDVKIRPSYGEWMSLTQFAEALRTGRIAEQS